MARRLEDRFDYDVIIIGGGPAGLSAAVVLARCLRRVLVCDSGRPRNAATHGVHNFLTRDGIEPLALLRLGRREAIRYGAKFLHGEVVRAACNEDSARVTLRGGRTHSARKLLLATGVRDELPRVKGLAELYGASVHHCPYCDGWEYRGQPIAILGLPHAATGLALSMLTWSRDLIVCTNGIAKISDRDRRRLRRHRIELRTQKIQRLDRARGRLKQIVFADGTILRRSAVFFCSERRQSPLVHMLGCRLDDEGMVISDRKGRSGIPHLFMAGDANGDVQFAIVAAAEGATAGVAINRELQEDDLRKSSSPRTQTSRMKHV